MTQDFFDGAPYNAIPNNGGVTVATSSGLLITANANRQGLIITNSGSNPVYLAFGGAATASVGTGVYLAANGGAFQLDSNFKWQGSIQAIASGGSSVVTFAEL